MIVTQDSIVRKVLAQANADQNQQWPPHVIDEHFELTSDQLLDEIAKLWPTNTSVKMVGKPFLKTRDIMVVNGLIPLPDDFRYLIGMRIFLTPDEKGLCKVEDLTAEDVADQRLLARSKPQTAVEVDQKEWEWRINHSYKGPTLKKPITCMFDGGQADKTSETKGAAYKISPGASIVEMSYLKQPKAYKYGYILNPDDTYQYDPSKGVESEWDDTATQYLFKGMNLLYSCFTRDLEMRDSAQILKQTGLF